MSQKRTADDSARGTFRAGLTHSGFGLGHFNFSNRFSRFKSPNAAMTDKAGSRWSKMTHDHVFLKSAQKVDFGKRGSLCENSSRILERSRGYKAVRFERRLRDPEQNRNRLRRLASLLDHPTIFFFEFESINLVAPQQHGVSGFSNLHFAQHLPNDNFDVLIVNFDPLQAVDFLNLVYQVLLQILRAANLENLVRYNRTFGQL